jgi:hypothetical protein
MSQNSDKSKLILDYLYSGYLFHGSTNSGIEKFEPRTALDDDLSKEFNNDTAIFATEYPESAVLFALINRNLLPEELSDLTWGVNWLEDKVQAEIPKQWEEHLVKFKGYLYVLPKDNFKTKTPGGGQYKSYEEVIPQEMIEVTFQDFLDLGGEVIWT